MTYILSDKTFDTIETIQLEAHNKIIETIANELCQKRVTAPAHEQSEWYDGKTVHLDKNGPYHIEGIIDYDHDPELIFVEVYDDNMENRCEVVIT